VVVRLVSDGARLPGVQDAEVRYVERDEEYLAYSVFGDGPVDLAITQTQFPIDLMWDLPQLAAFMDALGAIARVIVWDSRGFGASDPRGVENTFNEAYADDLGAVLRAAGAHRPTLFEMSSGTQSLVFAATHPDRIRSMILTNVRSSYPELRSLSPRQRKQLAMRLRSPEWLRIANPRVAHDPVLQRWWGRSARLLNSPEQQARNLQTSAESAGLEAILPAVRTPTLVLHRRDNNVWGIDASRAATTLIPNARFVELPGAENDIFLGDTAPVLAEIEGFLAQPVTETALNRVLATVLFTDIVASTEQLAAHGDDAWRHLLDDHDAITDRIVSEYRGRVVKSTGDGILATFDGPARAVRCAAALLDAAKGQGIALRAGLHTGEIELRPTDVAGIAVHIAQRISGLAEANEILVSRTVVDLTAGSGLQFEPRGEHQLKGVPGTWPVFAADTPTPV
jgi:class 3 adenylate cyclase